MWLDVFAPAPWRLRTLWRIQLYETLWRQCCRVTRDRPDVGDAVALSSAVVRIASCKGGVQGQIQWLIDLTMIVSRTWVFLEEVVEGGPRTRHNHC